MVRRRRSRRAAWIDSGSGAPPWWGREVSVAVMVRLLTVFGAGRSPPGMRWHRALWDVSSLADLVVHQVVRPASARPAVATLYERLSFWSCVSWGLPV